MKTAIFCLTFFVILGVAGIALTLTSTPLKISTNLIQIDVSVTDKNGKVVRNLKPDDFEIYEDGKMQPITNFSFVSLVDTVPDPVTNKNDKVPVPIPETLRPET